MVADWLDQDVQEVPDLNEIHTLIAIDNHPPQTNLVYPVTRHANATNLIIHTLIHPLHRSKTHKLPTALPIAHINQPQPTVLPSPHSQPILHHDQRQTPHCTLTPTNPRTVTQVPPGPRIRHQHQPFIRTLDFINSQVTEQAVGG